MTQSEADQPEGSSIFSWFIRARKTKQSEHDKDLRRAEFTQRIGRTSPERYRARMAEIRRELYSYVAFALGVQFIKVNFFHHHFIFDVWIWFALTVGPIIRSRVVVIRRLHDVGFSGWALLNPLEALAKLHLPSGPPNQWGLGPDLLEEKGSA